MLHNNATLESRWFHSVAWLLGSSGSTLRISSLGGVFSFFEVSDSSQTVESNIRNQVFGYLHFGQGSYCIREITKNSICSIDIQQKFKHNRTGISIPKAQFNSSNTEKMLFIVSFTYKKWGLKGKGMEGKKRTKVLVGLLGVKDLDPLKLTLTEKGMRSWVLTILTRTASLPSPLLPQFVLPAEQGGCSPRSQSGGPRSLWDTLSIAVSRRLGNSKNQTPTGWETRKIKSSNTRGTRPSPPKRYRDDTWELLFLLEV